MFSYEDWYKLYNVKTEGRYQELIEELSEAIRHLSSQKERGFREKLFLFLRAQGEYLLTLTEMEAKWTEGYYQSASLAELQDDQKLLYEDRTTQAYEQSYLNPAYMSGWIGREVGPVLAALAKIFKEASSYAYTHRRFMLCEYIAFYLEMEKRMLHGQVRADGLTVQIKRFMDAQQEIMTEMSFHENYNVSNGAILDLISREDLNGPYYLYQLGLPVAEQEIQLQQFLANLSQEEIESSAYSMAEGFRRSFARDHKDLRGKKAVAIHYPLGMERLILRTAEILKQDMHMEPFVAHITSSAWNKQYEYDHRFDMALYLDEAYKVHQKEILGELIQDNESMLQGYAGGVYLESFGEVPFIGKTKEEALSLAQEQQQWLSQMLSEKSVLMEEIGKLKESSFTMMALPTPAIGECFEAVFHEMVKINQLDQDQIGKAQHSLIQTLDRGKSVYIRGRGGNETELTIALHALDNPKRQTNFYNELADCNIPAGEVYTTPQLTGTDGILHVEKAYLNGHAYENLKLTFENGYVTEYSCTNFEDQEEGKAYIRENLLHPYETLPMGEFAIGTNTVAYAMAQRYGILPVLPILIAEKLGPHFALGDTCFSYEEERAVYNPTDRKEIVARDNEQSLLRYSEPEKAYTGRHIDISLSFDSIGTLSVVKERGDHIDLIREGRFVLIGTDLLNIPMMAMDSEWKEELYVKNPV